jgi:CubicO group peptidase (beta-lactamase class C family)
MFAQAADVAAAPVASEVTAAGIQDFIDPLVLEQLQRRRIAGAVVVVVNDGAVIMSKGYGRADVAAVRAMDQHTIVRIASITKTLTALAVMQLVEAGKLNLDRDVNEYLEFVVPKRPGLPSVTLRRLLTHQTGFEDRHGGIAAWSGGRLPLGPFLARQLPPRDPLNSELVAYSNYNASLAAYIVERVSGERFEHYLDDHIFKPLGMTRTTAVQPLPDELSTQVSNGYVRADLLPTRESMGSATIHEVGSTGVSASGSDMARLMLELLDRDPKILSRDSLKTMMSVQARLSLGFYGLGVYSPLGRGCNAFVGHEGGTGGFQSALALLPGKRFGLFVSYNSQGLPETTPAPSELLQRVADRYFVDVKLPANANHSGNLAGAYQPTRRVDSNLFKLRILLEQLVVRPTADGKLAVAGITLDEIEPGRFRGPGLEVAFGGTGGSRVMQLEAPALYVPLSWWASTGVVVPIVMLCLLLAALTVLGELIALLRRRQERLDPITGRLKTATRVALLLDCASIGAAVWVVIWGPALVATSAAIIRPLVLGIYAGAWGAIVLTPFAIWHAARFVRRGAGGLVAKCRECLLAAILVILSAFCIYWRVAGTSLAF